MTAGDEGAPGSGEAAPTVTSTHTDTSTSVQPSTGNDQPVARSGTVDASQTAPSNSEETDATQPENSTGESEGQASDRIRDVLDSFNVSWMNSSGEPEQGPLYVLWELIESYRVDIFEVSLARITEDFIAFLRAAGDLQLDLASSFSHMASRLIYYKSKALLPDPGFEDPEEESRLPPELVQQLLEYRKFQLAADRLREREEITTGMLSRDASMVPESDGSAGEWLDVSLVDLIRAYADLLKRLDVPDEERHFEVQLEEFSVEDKIVYLNDLLERVQSFTLDELFEQRNRFNRGELIATFLALLELTRQGMIILRQKQNFSQIHVFKKTVLVH